MFSIITESGLALPPTPAVYLLSVSLPLLVLSESVFFHTGLAIFKIVSSIAFASGPLTSPEWSPYHRLITYGLVLSLIGDICLIPSRTEFYESNLIEESGSASRSTSNIGSPKPDISISFKLGVLAFAGAHVAYIIAFLKHAENISWSLLIGTFVATMALARLLGVIYPGKGYSSSNNILNLTISGEMRPLVFIYATIISSMLAVSAATTSPEISSEFPRQRLLGAILFVISDLFVAKDAFGDWEVPKGSKAGAGRYAWPKVAMGYGLYFWGQMVLAGTVYEWFV
jgi:uncharacterized membrane protein YhhN